MLWLLLFIINGLMLCWLTHPVYTFNELDKNGHISLSKPGNTKYVKNEHRDAFRIYTMDMYTTSAVKRVFTWSTYRHAALIKTKESVLYGLNRLVTKKTTHMSLNAQICKGIHIHICFKDKVQGMVFQNFNILLERVIMYELMQNWL